MSNSRNTKIIRLLGSWVNDYLPLRNVTSDKTLKNYESSLCLFLEFLEKEKGIKIGTLSAASFETGYIEEWMDWLHGTRACGASTCNNRLSALRSFLKYVSRNEKSLSYLYVEAQAIPLLKTVTAPVEGMSRKGLKTLFSVIDQRNRTGRKYLTLFTLVYNCGLRIDEALSITLKDLHLEAEHPSVTVIGKGSKMRTLAILPRTRKLLEAYIATYHGKAHHETHYLFYSRNTGPTGKSSQTAISKQLRIYAKQAHEICSEVPLDLHCHQFRHACATHLLEDGINIVQLSRFLGHSNLSTTMRYIDVGLQMETEALAKIDCDSNNGIKPKWKKSQSLAEACGLKPNKASR